MVKTDYKNKDITTLITLAQNGDIDSLEELIRRIQKNVFTMFSYLTGKKQDIADLTQEALFKMAKNIKKIKEPKNFKPWLNKIITNVFYDYLKKQSFDAKLDTDSNKLLEIKDKIGCEPGEKCLFSEIEKLIKAAMLCLPENLRVVIVLREFEGLSYDDISRITNTTLGTVKSRIARAREKLQNELRDFL